jgi:hypothetical protein
VDFLLVGRFKAEKPYRVSSSGLITNLPVRTTLFHQNTLDCRTHLIYNDARERFRNLHSPNLNCLDASASFYWDRSQHQSNRNGRSEFNVLNCIRLQSIYVNKIKNSSDKLEAP